MEVTIKKAAALAEAVGLAGEFVQAVTYNKYSDKPLAEELARDEALAATGLQERLRCVGAQYQLRALIGAANAAAISPLLTQRAMLDAQLKMLRAVETRADEPDFEALERQRAAQREQKEYAFGENGITLQTLAASAVDPLVRRLQRERTDVQDQLTALNFTTTIQIPEDLVAVLQAHELV